jgi:N-acetylmuramoyl-L-alanine amidase
MIECGFLSNPEEAALLITEDYQRDVAYTIFNGLCEFSQVNA